MSDKPKRPLSAYMLWLGEHREQIKRENPNYKVTEIAKRGGELWRGLPDKTVSIFPSDFLLNLLILDNNFFFRALPSILEYSNQFLRFYLIFPIFLHLFS